MITRLTEVAYPWERETFVYDFNDKNWDFEQFMRNAGILGEWMICDDGTIGTLEEVIYNDEEEYTPCCIQYRLHQLQSTILTCQSEAKLWFPHDGAD